MYPPSTRSSAPVTYLLASLSKKVTGPMRSSGTPILPWGIREVQWRLRSGFSSRILRVLAVECAWVSQNSRFKLKKIFFFLAHDQRYRDEMCKGGREGGKRREKREENILEHLQGCQHVSWTDAVNSDICAGPLNSQAGGKMPDCSLSRVVWGLWLGHVNNGTRHATNQHKASWSFALHKMFGHSYCEKIGTVDDNAPELLHTVVGVGDRVEVLRESGGGNEVVNLSMLFDDLAD